jgi:DNA-binding transcriptional MerR regulator
MNGDNDAFSALAVAWFQPAPDALYSLEVTAQLAGLPRRTILLYCRARLVQPVFQAPYGAMAFSEEAIYTLRRIEHLRAARGLDLAWIKHWLELLDELERLRAELRFHRQR